MTPPPPIPTSTFLTSSSSYPNLSHMSSSSYYPSTSSTTNTNINSSSSSSQSSQSSTSPYSWDTLRPWLEKAVAMYTHPDRLITETELILKSYPTLFPKLDVYTHVDGISTRLLHFYGTLPIHYQQSMYHIPIGIWFPLSYPIASPYIYIRPTSTMIIQPSKHVDRNGKVTHHSLLYWDHNSSKLLLLLQQLQHTFSQTPPVYSKPSSSYSSSSSSLSATSTTTNTPSTRLPTSTTLSTSLPFPASSSSSSSSSTSPISLLQESAPSSLPPPLKPMTSLQIKYDLHSISYQCDLLFQEYAQRVSLKMDSLVKENQYLHSTQAQTLQFQTTLKNELHRLQHQVTSIQSFLSSYEFVIDQMESHTQNEQQWNIDDLWSCVAPTMTQWRELVADDLAIEDTLYQLSQHHSKEKMETSAYLKHVRSLAKEQFLVRALAKKCATLLENVP